MALFSLVSVAQVRDWLSSDIDCALIDTREHGEYGASHCFYSVSIPFSRLEADIERMLPRKAARVMLYDDGVSGVAERFAERTARLGYTNLCVMEGGAAAWAAAGHNLFAGVNVLSKTFGELVEHQFEVPNIDADALHTLMGSGEDIVVLDGRPFHEYQKMNIPGSICCPNGELAYRLNALVPSPDTKVIINCAGRTRSIIGAQTLRLLGVCNEVRALRDGTMGWLLSGRQLEHGADRSYRNITVSQDELTDVRDRARKVAVRDGVEILDDESLCRIVKQAVERTTYFLDVRTEEEFNAGHFSGTVHAPGGQLIQATDHWIAARNPQIVLIDSDGVRSIMVAQWLHKMGYDVAVYTNESDWERFTVPAEKLADSILPSPKNVRLVEAIADGALLLDIRPSMEFRRKHLVGSRWVTRRNLKAILGSTQRDSRVILVADDPTIARAYSADLAGLGFENVGLYRFDEPDDIPKDMYVTESADPPDEECIDYLFFVHDRHNGNLASARAYLAWEKNLVGSLDAHEARFHRLSHQKAEEPSAGIARKHAS